MAQFIVYNTSTGEIIRHGTCQDCDLSLQAQAGETHLPVAYQPGTVVNGAIVPTDPAVLEAAKHTERRALIAGILAQRKAGLNV
jgi:hypothetical protein